MNSSKKTSLVLRSAAVTLLAGAALLLGACSTAPSAKLPSAQDSAQASTPTPTTEKGVTFARFHSEMERLAHENSDWGAVSPSAVVASNP
jgi:hypothetical protein